MQYEIVADESQLSGLLSALSESDLVGFDTEFVAEDCYEPDLCLVQVSTRDKVFIVDPKSIPDLGEFWNLLVDPDRTVVVHAGREEILFVYRATGKTMANLIDVQVAVGLLGGEYPASYGKLLQRFLSINAPKGETRTDWRRRPLTQSQLDYAALDVLHLPELFDRLTNQLRDLGRLEWLSDDLARRQEVLVEVKNQESWHRMSGIQSLQRSQLGIVRELWKWREERAQSKNMPARRVLRDDLIIELAKRGFSDPKRVSQIRGLHHSGFQRFLPDLAGCVARGKEAPTPKAPWTRDKKRPRPPALLQQFLTAAMSYLCRTNRIAPAIVGTSDDVGRLASFWLEKSDEDESSPDFPKLLTGWRREFVGEPLHDIFLGRRGLRVQNPHDDMPLSLCELD